MELKKELIKRQIAGDTVLVPVGKTVYDCNGLFVLNELGDFIWELLPEADSREDVLKAILNEYEVDPETAKADMDRFFAKLEELGIV